MAMFLGHLAFMFELAVFVAGMVLWHNARQGAAGALRAGGLIAMIGGALSALCTGYYLIRYSVQGELDHAYSGMAMHETMKSGAMMGGGMMGGSMMKEGMKKEGMPEGMPGAALEEQPADPDHAAHHPDQVAP